MKSLLVPINFSDNAANAARYATDLALAIDLDVHLLHVLDLGYDFEQTEEKARDLLNTMREELHGRARGQVAITTSVILGDVEMGIEECCKRQKPFAVVMGADDEIFHGGYPSDHIANAVGHLPYPLLVIPAGATFHTIRKIALACDLTDISSQLPVSLEFLQQLKFYFACSFDIINVSDKNEKGMTSLFKQTLQDLFPELHFVTSSQVEEGIRDYLNNKPVDWLMVFPKKHGLLEFHKSQSKRIVTNCPIPVLSVRA